MKDYDFTQNWFLFSPMVWTQLLPHLPSRKRFLEVGSFEGRSAVWIVENMMEDGGELVCVDTWQGGEDHTKNEMFGAEERFDANINLLKSRFPNRQVAKVKTTSVKALAALISVDPMPQFDFAYIDGSHTAPDTLTDACLAWPMIKGGGVLVFDDYLWGQPRDALHRPKTAVDAFCSIFAESLVFLHFGYQLVIKKTH